MKLTKKLTSLLLSVLIISSCFVLGTVVSNAAQDGGFVSGNDTYQMSDDIPFAIDSFTDKLVVVTTLNKDYPTQTEIKDKTVNVTVTYYLTAPEMIVDGQGFVTYDNTKLRLVSMELPKIADMLWKNESVSANKARFSFSELNAFDFTKGGEFVVLTFEVIGDANGTASVDLTIEELDAADKIYFKAGVAEDATVLSSLVTPTVTNGEPPTTESTPAESEDDSSTPSASESASTDSSEPNLTSPSSSSEQLSSSSETQSSSSGQPSSSSNPTESSIPTVTDPPESDEPSSQTPTESEIPSSQQPSSSDSDGTSAPTGTQVPSTDPPESESSQPTSSETPSDSSTPTESQSASTDPTESQSASTDPTESQSASTTPTESKTPSTDSTTESQTSSTDSTTESTEPTESQTLPTDPTTEAPSTGLTTEAPTTATEATTVESIPAVGPGADAKDVEKLLTKTKDDEAPDGSTFNLLQVKNTKTTKKVIQLSYKNPKGTKKFVIYGAKCGKKYKVLKTTKAKSVKIKKLKKGKYYKFLVVALDKNNKVVATSKTIHVATKGGKYGNPSKVTIKKIKKKAVTIKQGKTLKLKTKAKADKGVTVKTHRKVAFESTNTKVATVSKKGKIKAKKTGTATIFAYAQNGVMAKIKIKVK